MILRGDSFKSDEPLVEMELPGDEPEYDECAECEGCGAVSSEAGNHQPWPKVAAEIMAGDDRLKMAVDDGLIEPIQCPACRGEGVVIE